MNPILESLITYVTDLENKITTNTQQTTINEIKSKLTTAALYYQSLKVPYKYNGTYAKDKAFDCSSFMQQIFHDASITIPRSSRQQALIGTDTDTPQLGDLVIIDRSGDGVPDHVGMAITDTLMIHTAGNPEGINVCNFRDRYGKNILTIRRVL